MSLPTNVIDSDLQLTEFLEGAIMEFERTILPLGLFAHNYGNVQLRGDDTVTVRYSPIATSQSKRRAPGESLMGLASAVNLEKRQIAINRQKVQGIAYTAEEFSRQPMVDWAAEGEKKGRKLAFDVIQDVLGVVTAGAYSGTTLAAMDPANFDTTDVKDLAKICTQEDWPTEGRGLILTPDFHFELANTPALLDLSQSGSGEVLRAANLPDVFGFRTIGSNGLKTLNLTATVCTAATTDLITPTIPSGDAIDDYYPEGSAVEFATSAADLPAGLSAATRYYVRDLDLTAGTFKVSATVGGAAVDITDAGTGVHTVQRLENLGGLAVYESAILFATSPLILDEAILRQVYDYRMVPSGNSGLTLEYFHIGDGDKLQAGRFLMINYGRATGELAAIKRIEDSTL